MIPTSPPDELGEQSERESSERLESFETASQTSYAEPKEKPDGATKSLTSSQSSCDEPKEKPDVSKRSSTSFPQSSRKLSFESSTGSSSPQKKNSGNETFVDLEAPKPPMIAPTAPEPAVPSKPKRDTVVPTSSLQSDAVDVPQSNSHRLLPHGINLPGLMNRPAQIPRRYSATKPPKQALQAVYDAGKYKAGLTLEILAIQSFMAGIYIAMAGHLFLSVGGGVIGAALFPTGLFAVILASGELFTGDAFIFVAGVLGRQVKFRSLLRNWTVAWCCNFLGCVVWAALLGYCSDSLADIGKVDYAIAVARKKAFQPWLNIFLKGIGANFMVCLGVWQATCAEEVAGKILAIWFPIAGFVIMGFDHCVANQFLIPLGMMLGAKDISITRLLFQALLPATIGNVVGGGILIGAVYWYVFDSMESFNGFRDKIRQAWSKPKMPRSSSFRSSSFAFRRSVPNVAAANAHV